MPAVLTVVTVLGEEDMGRREDAERCERPELYP